MSELIEIAQPRKCINCGAEIPIEPMSSDWYSTGLCRECYSNQRRAGDEAEFRRRVDIMADVVLEQTTRQFTNDVALSILERAAEKLRNKPT